MVILLIVIVHFVHYTFFLIILIKSLNVIVFLGMPLNFLSIFSVLDAVQKIMSAPKDCMNTVRSDFMSYMSLPNSPTYELAITNLRIRYHYYMVGLFIPVIPDVKFHTINIKSSDMHTEFYDVVQNIARDRIFKGILVYVTDKYLLHSVEDIIFLNHIKEL